MQKQSPLITSLPAQGEFPISIRAPVFEPPISQRALFVLPLTHLYSFGACAAAEVHLSLFTTAATAVACVPGPPGPVTTSQAHLASDGEINDAAESYQTANQRHRKHR